MEEGHSVMGDCRYSHTGNKNLARLQTSAGEVTELLLMFSLLMGHSTRALIVSTDSTGFARSGSQIRIHVVLREVRHSTQ